jgi:hypothetical protein
LTEFLVTKVCEKENVYLSIIDREKSNFFKFIIKIIFVLFTKYRSQRLLNARYTLSRYYFIKLAKRLEFYNKINYCFSHAGKYTSFLISSGTRQVSIDVEPKNRRLPESLRLKIRALFPLLKLKEIKIILILESLVKHPVTKYLVDLSKGLDKICPIYIKKMEKSVFEISIKNIKVYSKFYTFTDLYVCVTIDSEQSDIFL